MKCKKKLHSEKILEGLSKSGRRNGATDSASDCCTILGAVAGFKSLTIIWSPKCLVDPDCIIDT